MRRALRVVVPVCAVIFAANIVILNTVYRGRELPGALWLPMMLGVFVTGAVAVVGVAILVATRVRGDRTS